MEPKLGDMYIDSCNDLCYFVYNGNKWVKCFYNNINDDNYFMDLAHRIDDIENKCYELYCLLAEDTLNADLDKSKDSDYYDINFIKWHLLSAQNKLDASMKICKKHLRSEV